MFDCQGNRSKYNNGTEVATSGKKNQRTICEDQFMWCAYIQRGFVFRCVD